MPRGKVVGLKRRKISEKVVLRKYDRIKEHLHFTFSGLKKRKRIGRIVLQRYNIFCPEGRE